MLQQILKLIRANEGVVSVRSLAQQLGAEPSAVDGMIQQLVHMGKLKYSSGHAKEENCGSCKGCTGTDDCPLLFYVPRRIELVDSTDSP